jgi:hypothetical protein
MAFTKYCLIVICLTAASAKPASDLATHAAEFATAALHATLSAQRAYGLVESVYYRSRVELMARHYAKNGFEPGSIQPFLSAQDIQLRLSLLGALRAYAASLGDLSGSKDADAVDKETSAIGTSLANLESESFTQSFAKDAQSSVSAGALRAGAAGIGAIGHFLQERRRRKELPGIIARMQGALDGVVQLIVEDIGNGPGTAFPAGNGLRGQAWISADSVLRDQVLFIDGNELPAVQKRAEIEKLAVIDEERRSTDAGLASVQSTLRTLASAHRALLTSDQHPASFQALIGEMEAESAHVSVVMKGR